MASRKPIVFSARYVLAGILLGCVASQSVKCPKSFSALPDTSDCRQYFQCVFYNPVKMPCQIGMGFSAKNHICTLMRESDCEKKTVLQLKPLVNVPNPNAVKDKEGKPANPTETATPKSTTSRPTKATMSTTTMSDTTALPTTNNAMTTTSSTENTTDFIKPVGLRRSIEEECLENPFAKFPHPTECALYYDCSVIYKTVPKYFEQFLTECGYPELFSERTRRCDHYSRVKCGRRREVTGPCEYRQNWCQTPNCKPCNARFPSCSDQPDGVNAWTRREWTPYFVHCDKGRLTDQGLCEHNKGYPALFSPDSRSCVSIFSVPKKFGGLQPDCDKKSDGFYPDENGEIDKYFECRGGEHRGSFKCPHSTVFDPESWQCKDSKYIGVGR